jgi:hypothetical protein
MSNNDMRPLPRIHPREAAVKTTERNIGAAIDEAVKGLTAAEAVRAVNEAFGSWLGGLARSWIRQERHGDTDKPGGAA